MKAQRALNISHSTIYTRVLLFTPRGCYLHPAGVLLFTPPGGAIYTGCYLHGVLFTPRPPEGGGAIKNYAKIGGYKGYIFSYERLVTVY